MIPDSKTISILNILQDCKDAVLNKDVTGLIRSIEQIKIDTRCNNPLMDYVKQLIIDDITNYLLSSSKDSLKIIRKGEYNTNTYDAYVLKDGELYRNGHKAHFGNVGKLYQAYKKIHNLK